MTRRRFELRHVANGAALVIILVIAGGISHTTPDDEQQQGPIIVRGELGETMSGRNIRATVDDVRIAESVTASNGWAGSTSGVWIVVDLSVEAVVDDFGVSLGTAVIRVGDTTWSASPRPDDGTIAETSLDVGIPRSGPLMFEVPRDLVSSEGGRTAQLQLGEDSDPRADSLLVIPVDLALLDVEKSIETSEPVWGTR
jgi:hypothetical protein